MNPIEPNLAALGWFAAFWTICCLGFLQLAGMYPLASRSTSAPRALVVGNSALWLLVLAVTCLFAYSQLRPTTIVVAGGVLFLFVPELFQALPQPWRDGHVGLTVTAIALCLALVLLIGLAAAPITALF
jgi:hypothetical protein